MLIQNSPTPCLVIQFAWDAVWKSVIQVAFHNTVTFCYEEKITEK